MTTYNGIPISESPHGYFRPQIPDFDVFPPPETMKAATAAIDEHFEGLRWQTMPTEGSHERQQASPRDKWHLRGAGISRAPSCPTTISMVRTGLRVYAVIGGWTVVPVANWADGAVRDYRPGFPRPEPLDGPRFVIRDKTLVARTRRSAGKTLFRAESWLESTGVYARFQFAAKVADDGTVKASLGQRDSDTFEQFVLSPPGGG